MLKAICGYRDDQEVPVPAEDAHKAYYVYATPGARTVLSNGHTLRHEDVQRIAPDYHAAMGWRKGYRMGPDDHAEVESSGTERKIRALMGRASDTAKLAQKDPSLLAAPLALPDATKLLR